MLYDHIKERMLAHPDQTVGDERRVMTYRELLEDAERMGRGLDREKYGILCRSELDTARALLACFFAGKTAVPLSYRYGESHTRKIIAGMRLSHLLTDKGTEEAAPVGPEPEDLTGIALIMSTSGTTGDPKGAMITQENLLANLRDIEAYFRLEDTDHILIARPLYHCAVLTGEFLFSLLRGVKITFTEAGFNPARLSRLISRGGITVLGGTPTLFYHLSGLIRRSGKAPLRVMAVSGECMTRTVAEEMRGAFPQTLIYHVYGLTEASPRAAWLPPEQFDDAPLSVGRPLDSLRARIVDGELQLAGPSIMKGYYNRPEATDRALEGGWLHTGDMAERDGAGRLYIRGRRDNMIIRSGMNIYPQEIENALRGERGIAEALAFGVRDERVGQRIHLQVATDLTRAEVYRVCQARLPGFQLPDVIEVVKEIPKNASGKILRKGRDGHGNT